MECLNTDGYLAFPSSKDGRIQVKRYLHQSEEWSPPLIIYRDRSAVSGALEKLMGAKVFDDPKSTDVLARLFHAVTEDGDLILDFFACSGSTGQAVWEQNPKDGKTLHWILVQVPEQPDDSKESGRNAIAAGYEAIFEITAERPRRTAPLLEEETPDQGRKQPPRLPPAQIHPYVLVRVEFAQWHAVDISPWALFPCSVQPPTLVQDRRAHPSGRVLPVLHKDFRPKHLASRRGMNRWITDQLVRGREGDVSTRSCVRGKHPVTNYVVGRRKNPPQKSSCIRPHRQANDLYARIDKPVTEKMPLYCTRLIGNADHELRTSHQCAPEGNIARCQSYSKFPSVHCATTSSPMPRCLREASGL